MPQPTASDVHVDAPLTDISVAFIQNSANFIADKVFPIVPVSKQSDKYFTWDRNNFFRDEAAKRAPGSETAGGGIELTTDSYSCDVWGHHKDIDDQTRSNADTAATLDDAAAEYVAQKFLIRRERQFVTDFFGTGIWTTDVTGSTDFTKWDDAGSDPEKDVQVGKKTILSNTGFEPNKLVVSFDVHQALKRHPLIKDRFKYTSSESITDAMIARFFEVDSYLVAKAVYATNAEAAATDAYAFTHGKHAMLVYSPPSPGLMQPAAGYNFVWSGYTGLNNLGVRMKRFRMENIESDRIEGTFAFDMKKVAADLGYFFASAVA